MAKSTQRVSAILRQHREAVGLSISTVVDTLDREFKIKISEKTLYGYENGVSSPKVSTFVALCTIYNVKNLSSEFGYPTSVCVTSDDNDWAADIYDDFFNASILEKVFILMKHGVPSFSGYENQLAASFPSNADIANFNRLYNIFKKLDSDQHDSAFFALDELAQGRYANVTHQDLKVLSMLRPYLCKLNEEGTQKLRDYASGLVASGRYSMTEKSLLLQIAARSGDDLSKEDLSQITLPENDSETPV